MSGSNVSWPAYRYLRMQVRGSGIPMSLRIFRSLLWSSQTVTLCDQTTQTVWSDTVKGFSIVNEAEVNAFLEFSSFLYVPTDVGNLFSGSSAFSKSSLYIWEFPVHVLLKPSLENFEHYFASMWNKCNCVVVWTFFTIDFLWDRNENWLFPVLQPLLSFPNLLAYWVQHFHSIIF